MGIIDVGSATHEGIYTEQTMQRHSYGWVRAEAFEAGRRALSKGPLRHYCVIQLKCTGDVTRTFTRKLRHCKENVWVTSHVHLLLDYVI